MSGWISLHRKILDNPILSFGRNFSRAEAWIWLLLRANYEERKVVIGSDIYRCKKGQLITSQLKLCKTFNWGNSRLKTFLKLLQKDKMINLQTNSKLTLITVLNYESYQTSNMQTNIKQISNKVQPRTNNNINNNNKENNIKIAEFEKWWNLYNKKVGKKEALQYWIKKINHSDFIDIFNHTRKYIVKNEKQYRKDPIRYFRRETWKDEIVDNIQNDITQFKLDTTGKFYIGYCDKCNESDFYTKEGIFQDSRCCNNTLNSKRR